MNANIFFPFSEEKSHKEESIDQNSSMPLRKRLKTETNSINSFFKQSKTSTDKENRREQTNPTGKRPRRSKTKIEPIQIENNSFSSVQVEKTSLILFDEVPKLAEKTNFFSDRRVFLVQIETLTDDDQFWSSLKKLLETAKKPIILTSNSRTNPEKAIVNLSKISFFELIHLETLDLVRWICDAENSWETFSFSGIDRMFRATRFTNWKPRGTSRWRSSNSDSILFGGFATNFKRTSVFSKIFIENSSR